MHGSAQPDRFPPAGNEDASQQPDPKPEREPEPEKDRSVPGNTVPGNAVPGNTVGDRSHGSHALEEEELGVVLQLLVERAQYITGATGTALALPQGNEMVCRASAGSSAPAVGARLQVRSGLTGESIARRQLLRCDNAETDPRVNLETCRALGIASIVVLPLLRRTGEVRGLLELFSDHPYAFEERDLIALERMADLTLTALDLAEQRETARPASAPPRDPGKPVEAPAIAASAVEPPAIDPAAIEAPAATVAQPPCAMPVAGESTDRERTSPASLRPGTIAISSPPANLPEMSPAMPAIIPAEPASPSEPVPIPAAMLRVQKCATCGFPVSEGRTLCLDCEKKEGEKKKQREKEKGTAEQPQEGRAPDDVASTPASASASALTTPEEFIPAFLANSVPVQESWLANHVNLLAIIVLILGILVAVVVFR